MKKYKNVGKLGCKEYSLILHSHQFIVPWLDETPWRGFFKNSIRLCTFRQQQDREGYFFSHQGLHNLFQMSLFKTSVLFLWEVKHVQTEQTHNDGLIVLKDANRFSHAPNSQKTMHQSSHHQCIKLVFGGNFATLGGRGNSCYSCSPLFLRIPQSTSVPHRTENNFFLLTHEAKTNKILKNGKIH